MFFKYPSIDHLKQVKYDIQKIVGIGKMPTLQLQGTVKIHGTNGGVTVTRDEDLHVQSRNRILTENSDNAGFFKFVDSCTYFDITRQNLCNQYSHLNIFTIYGEWCGGNIQKGVGVSGMEPVFIIFSVKGRETEESDPVHIPLEDVESAHDQGIFLVTDFDQYSYELDLSSQESIEGLEAITLKVEECCPVAKKLNPEGNLIGEGVVWTTNYSGKWFKFKHKGTKHARGGGSKKVVVSNNYTPEQVTAVEEFCKEALKVDRLMQGLEYLSEMGLDTTPKNTGQYIKWVMQDIHKEMQPELASLEKTHEITWKAISKQLISSVKDYYATV